MDFRNNGCSPQALDQVAPQEVRGQLRVPFPGQPKDIACIISQYVYKYWCCNLTSCYPEHLRHVLLGWTSCGYALFFIRNGEELVPLQSVLSVPAALLSGEGLQWSATPPHPLSKGAAPGLAAPPSAQRLETKVSLASLRARLRV